jgi:anti-sigma B factor antagonist
MTVLEPKAEPRRIHAGSLSIEVVTRNHASLATLAGELDMAATPALERELQALLDADVEAVVLDLSKLEFIDSTGLHCLIRATSRSRASGNRLRMIAPPTGQVGQVIALTRVGDVLPLTDAA